MANRNVENNYSSKDESYKPGKSGKKRNNKKKRSNGYSKTNRSSEGKSRMDKSKDKYSASEEDKEYMNDPAWYIADINTMQQAMGFSFDNFIGRDVNLEIHDVTLPNGASATSVDKLGSIMSFYMAPSIGYTGIGSAAKLSAINQQGFKLYARLSSVNSKNTQYAPQDVTTLILAMGEVISLISHIQRAFGLMWTYNIRNRNMPVKLIDATGIDSTDLYNNIAQYRIRFNTLMVQANKIPFPSNIDYFSKCAQLYSDVYKDSEDDMSQMYLFRPFYTWTLDENSSTEGTKLVTTDVSSSMSGLLDQLSAMLETLLTSATYNYIYSDIINFLNRPGNSAKLLYYTTIPEDYVVVPVYNYAMLGQITNVTVLSPPVGKASETDHTHANDVIPDMDNMCLTYAPKFTRSRIPSLSMDRYLNFGEQDPDVMTRIENSRYCNMALGSVADSDNITYFSKEVALSDHYCLLAKMFSSENANGLSFTQDINTASADTLQQIPLVSDFDWAPLMYLWTVDDTTHSATLLGSMGDMKHFTTINPETMKLINELALYGLYEPRDFEYELVK